MVDVVIIGAGPAGLSAAIQLARSNRSVLLFDRGKQRASFALNYHNYLGFPDGIAGKKLLELGRDQAEKYGVKIIQAEATAVKKTQDGQFTVEAGNQAFTGRRVIFATGVSDNTPNVPDVFDFLGRSIFHCLDCDGYELIGKKVVVFGKGNAAADAALRVLTFSKQVFIASNGEQLSIDEKYLAKLKSNGIDRIETPIKELQGNKGQLSALIFADNSEREVEFGLSTAGSKANNKLALGLGVTTIPNGHILVDKDMKTSIEHVYAIGDVINSSEQVSLAVAEGVRAAIMVNKTLREDYQTVF
ncbi:MAG TPA: NAD(P)/FAD-dependent oxidoreductase [Desulfobacteria bacterium]|nr:NAD(P)/FAD-dependent oxidoreductase [Desulfobacteria bacterium]